MTKHAPRIRLLRSHVRLVVVVLVVAAIGIGMAVWRQSSRQQTASNGPAVAVVSPKDASRVIKEPLSQFVNGLMGQYIGQTSGGKCERVTDDAGGSTQRCYQLQTVLFLVDGDVTSNLQQVVSNVNANGWNMDGEPLDASRIMQGIGSYDDTDTTQQFSAAARSQEAFAMITPAFFGEQSFLRKDDMGAVLQVYSMDNLTDPINESDLLYVLRSEIPAASDFDFRSKVIDPLKADKTKAVIVIAAGSVVPAAR